MWYDLKGTAKTFAGAAGTVTFNPGARILQILAVSGGSGGSIALPDGKGGTATIPLGDFDLFDYSAHHTNRLMGAPQGGLTIVFTGTTRYFVEYLEPAGVD